MEQKNFAIVALVCALEIMAVGYSLLAQNLTINGTANITSTWDVQITGITEGEATGGATNKTPASFTGTTATFDVELKNPGDKMIYNITVENKGSLNAKLTGLTVSPEETAETGIYYKVTGVTKNVTTLDAAETNTITVEVGWVATDQTTPEQKTVPLTVNLVYTQY